MTKKSLNDARQPLNPEQGRQLLQDRLVKELRLRGIPDIETANVFLPDFVNVYNQNESGLLGTGAF